jgi:hypothetical protein
MKIICLPKQAAFKFESPSCIYPLGTTSGFNVVDCLDGIRIE